MNLRLRLGLEWLVIALVATLVVIFAGRWSVTQSFDNLIYDRLSAVSRPPADNNILIVGIDDPSLAAIGKWPWDRNVHARLMEKLQAAGPRSITFDILLSEQGNPESDAALAGAFRGNAPVFIPLHFVSPGSDGRAYDNVLPIKPFSDMAAGIGHANLIFDSDGIVRRSNLCFRPEPSGKAWPHLMELAYRATSAKPSVEFVRDKQCANELLIPYASRGSFAEISYADVLNGTVPEQLIKGRDVIVGATATGMGDNFPVPLADGALLPGVEIMANMLTALKRGNFISPVPPVATILVSLVPVWYLLIGFLRWRPRTVLIMSLLSIALVLIASAAALSTHWWFPPGSALIGIILIYPLWGWRRLQAMSDFMSTELGALRAEGEVVAVPVQLSPANDMIGRQSAELALAIDHMRDLRRFVSDTLADLPDPMFVTDPDGVVTLTNHALDERHGEYIIGLSMQDALEDQVAHEYRAAVREYLTANSGAKHFVRFVTRDSETLILRRAEIRSDAGALRGYIHYLADITELARAEDEREEVLQLLSHDMRAPQSAIIAALDGTIDADAKKRIERNARRTMQLAQDFVDIARMAETEFAGEDVLLADLTRDAADNFWPLAKERNLSITIEDNSDSAFVIAEPVSLGRAISNLLDNAIKFSPESGAVTISIRRTTNPYELEVAVADSGPGIDPEILPRLFTRFATDGKQHGRSKGLGLGLTYVQAVVERHGGTVSASNGKDGGACFRFTLPEAPDESEV